MTETAPNILLIMVDQMAAPALPIYGHRIVQAPNITSLGETGVIFDNAYCNFPLCAPSRFSMLSGRLPTSIDAFDNASEFPASIPTLPYYLESFGYVTKLCGKMHFIGPDQLHGYRERLTTDVYPSDFAWTPDWTEGEHSKPSGVSMRSVLEAGTCVRSLQLDYDEEVEHCGLQAIYDLARSPQQQPFFLTISFSHPHPPFVITEEYWSRYEHDAIDMPKTPPIPPEQSDAYSQWLHVAHGGDEASVTEEHVRNARHAYYGMISYIDDKIGRIVKALKETDLYQNTVIVFAGDHGEMLGERGMWYKQTFFEWSSRVPLIVAQPGVLKPGRRSEVVSLVDLLPTLLDLASGGDSLSLADPLDGSSMVGLLTGENESEWPDTAVGEYTAEGVRGPCKMVRTGPYKYVYTHGYPGQLFNLNDDPHERVNLCGRMEHADAEAKLVERLFRDWDPDRITERVLASQRRRRLIYRALNEGSDVNWAFAARIGDERRFVRGAGVVVEAKARSRFPYVEPATNKSSDQLVED